MANTRSVLQFASVGSRGPIGLSPKRTIDIVLALSGILLLAPLLIICCAATMLVSPGPVLFRHRRVGYNGKPFDCLKFRTMATDAPTNHTSARCKASVAGAAAASESPDVAT